MRLLLAAEESAQDAAEGVAPALAAEHAAQDAAERVVTARSGPATDGAAEDVAQDVTDAAAGRGGLGRRGRGAAAGELLGHEGQDDRGQNREQLLDQVAVTRTGTGQLLGDIVGVVVAEQRGDHRAARVLVDVLNVHSAVEESARGAADIGLQISGLVRVVRVGLQSAHQQRNHGFDRLVGRLAVDPELRCDLVGGNLVEQLVECGHGSPPR
ncbi:hypothetical protein BB28_08730 [Mycobacteroides chelonae CCUG 47445]|nr:hypothetical protein BB28_08730 [Mycobacteroides chelonae CCUG 47445]